MLSLYAVIALAGATIGQAIDYPDTAAVSGSPAPAAPPGPAPAPSGPPELEIPSSATHQWDRYRSVLALNLGIGSAVGSLGVTYSFSTAPFLVTEIGVGAGSTGTQYSLTQKIALGTEGNRSRFVAGAGIAYAYFTLGNTDYPNNLPVMPKSGSSVWANLDLAGWEFRAGSHFAILITGGVTVGLAGGKFAGWSDNPDCGPQTDCRFGSKVPGYVAPQGRVALGGWF